VDYAQGEHTVSNIDTLNKAVELPKSINCPEPIIDALWLFSFIVHGDDMKLESWSAWSEGQLIEGYIVTEDTPRLPAPKPKNILTIP